LEGVFPVDERIQNESQRPYVDFGSNELAFIEVAHLGSAVHVGAAALNHLFLIQNLRKSQSVTTGL
jgi:hypothetical protein